MDTDEHGCGNFYANYANLREWDEFAVIRAIRVNPVLSMLSVSFGVNPWSVLLTETKALELARSKILPPGV